MERWKLGLAGASFFIVGCLAGQTFQNAGGGAENEEAESVDLGSRPPLNESKGFSMGRIERLFELGREKPRGTLKLLQSKGRFEEMEFVIRGWIENDAKVAEEFLRFPPAQWSQKLASRQMAIVRAKQFQESPGRVIDEMSNVRGTPTGPSFYNEVILNMGWMEADRLVRRYAFYGEWLEGGGGKVRVEDHFREASVQIFLSWREASFENFKRIDGKETYEQVAGWYSDILNGPVWNELLRKKIEGFRCLFEKHEAGYREVLGER